MWSMEGKGLANSGHGREVTRPGNTTPWAFPQVHLHCVSVAVPDRHNTHLITSRRGLVSAQYFLEKKKEGAEGRKELMKEGIEGRKKTGLHGLWNPPGPSLDPTRSFCRGSS